MMEGPERNLGARGAAWTTTLFYLLIALEFFYMASPFAAYLYSAYQPGLGFLVELPGGSWLVGFFLPHYVETNSFWIDLHNPAGAVLLAGGLLGFVVGAVQVYAAKLTRRGVVTRGIYRVVRHPQYTALAVSGLGLLLLWPRYLALLLLVSMLFVYRMLAGLEESECSRKYGAAYTRYLQQSNRFLPFRIPGLSRMSAMWQRSFTFPGGRIAAALTTYLLASSAAIGVAYAAQTLTVRSLYAIYTDDSAFVALAEIPASKMQQVIGLAESHPDVAAKLALARADGSARFLNYILSEGRYVSEVPMHKPAGATGHDKPKNHRGAAYVVVFTTARFRTDRDVSGSDIFWFAVTRTPIVEVHVDLERDRVVAVLGPPSTERYRDVPVPIY